MVVDEHELILTDDVPPGEYQIEVGMYDWGVGERLAVSEGGQWVPENRVIWGQCICAAGHDKPRAAIARFLMSNAVVQQRPLVRIWSWRETI